MIFMTKDGHMFRIEDVRQLSSEFWDQGKKCMHAIFYGASLDSRDENRLLYSQSWDQYIVVYDEDVGKLKELWLEGDNGGSKLGGTGEVTFVRSQVYKFLKAFRDYMRHNDEASKVVLLQVLDRVLGDLMLGKIDEKVSGA